MRGRSFDDLVTALRAPVPADAGFEGRVIDRIHRARSVRRRLGVGAGLSAVLLASVVVWRGGGVEGRRIQFAIEAPTASTVTLVGDFNDWDRARTPLARAEGDRWEITLPLRSGVYRFAYLVDGRTWAADPIANQAPSDGDFGEPVSVLAVE